jgi:hypothetical protein
VLKKVVLIHTLVLFSSIHLKELNFLILNYLSTLPYVDVKVLENVLNENEALPVRTVWDGTTATMTLEELVSYR